MKSSLRHSITDSHFFAFINDIVSVWMLLIFRYYHDLIDIPNGKITSCTKLTMSLITKSKILYIQNQLTFLFLTFQIKNTFLSKQRLQIANMVAPAVKLNHFNTLRLKTSDSM